LLGLAVEVSYARGQSDDSSTSTAAQQPETGEEPYQHAIDDKERHDVHYDPVGA
jgi:hypothetical protein